MPEKVSGVRRKDQGFCAVRGFQEGHRLARNVHFISGLMETGVDFVAVDMPTADRFMLHVYAAAAEEEGRRISQRTKAALAAAKARGVELGKNGKALAERHKSEASAFALQLAPVVVEIWAEGHTSVRAVSFVMPYPDFTDDVDQLFDCEKPNSCSNRDTERS